MKSQTNPIEMLREDHDKVKKLFKEFEESDSEQEKKNLAKKAMFELKVHAIIEEEIFYPAVREESEEADLVNEAIEEHHIAKGLIHELETMELDREHYEAKFKVLSESVKHHIEEEESEMFPLVEGEPGSDLENLGQAIKERKQQLMEGGEIEREEAPEMEHEETIETMRLHQQGSGHPGRKKKQAKPRSKAA